MSVNSHRSSKPEPVVQGSSSRVQDTQLASVVCEPRTYHPNYGNSQAPMAHQPDQYGLGRTLAYHFLTSIAVDPRLSTGFNTAHCSPKFLGSSNPPASASQVVGTTGTCHPTWLILSLPFCKRQILTMLPRLVMNSWPQAILSSQPPKVLGLQAQYDAILLMDQEPLMWKCINGDSALKCQREGAKNFSTCQAPVIVGARAKERPQYPPLPLKYSVPHHTSPALFIQNFSSLCLVLTLSQLVAVPTQRWLTVARTPARGSAPVSLPLVFTSSFAALSAS
ncbi:Protein PPP5D1 [Plecturocebus cupreus]